MSTVSNANTYYANQYLNNNTQNKNAQSKTTSAQEALKNYTSQSSSTGSSSSDFMSSRIEDFKKQSEQYMALAKSKLTSKNAITSDMQNLLKAINSNDFTKIQSAFDTLTSHIDEKKLNSKTQSLLDKFEKLIDAKDSKSLKSVFYDISHNSNALSSAYSAATTNTTQPNSAAKIAIANDLKNLEKAVSSGKEATIQKAFQTLSGHLNETKLSTNTQKLLDTFENTIDDKNSKTLKSSLVSLQKVATELASAYKGSSLNSVA